MVAEPCGETQDSIALAEILKNIDFWELGLRWQSWGNPVDWEA